MFTILRGRSRYRLLQTTCLLVIIGVSRQTSSAQDNIERTGIDAHQSPVSQQATPTSADREKFENIRRLIRRSSGPWSGHYNWKVPQFSWSGNEAHSLSFNLANATSASRFASPRSATISNLPRRLTAFSQAGLAATVSDPNDNWLGGAGNWSTASKWSNGVPSNTQTTTYDVFIDRNNPQASQVTLDISATINSLKIDSDDSLAINDSQTLTVNGNMTNAGKISVNSAGLGQTEIFLGGASTNSGTITMSNGNNVISGGKTTLFSNTGTIQGSGSIGSTGGGSLALNNSGTINANQSAPLTLSIAGGVTNTGTLEATNGGTLNLSGGTYATSTAIQDNASTLLLSSVTVNGGAVSQIGAGTIKLQGATINAPVTNSGGGKIEVIGANTINGTLTNPGKGLVQIDAGAAPIMKGSTIQNDGTIALNAASLFIGAPNVTLQGTGTLKMSNNLLNLIIGSAHANILTNKETIAGAGNIGGGSLALNNSGSGVIIADLPAPLTLQISNGATNAGTIHAFGGGTLIVQGGTYTNIGPFGFFSCDTNSTNPSTMRFTSGAVINGGKVTQNGAGAIKLEGATINAAVDNSTTGTIEVVGPSSDTIGGTLTNPADPVKGTKGSVQIDAGGSLTMTGSAINNDGTITLNAAGLTGASLIIGAPNVTLQGAGTLLQGAGTLTMSNSGGNVIRGSEATNILTNKETIMGSGNIGGGSLALNNSGAIVANQPTALTLEISNGATNTGTLEAANGGTLIVEGGSYTNTGGTILNNTNSATPTTLRFTSGAVINGGTVTQTGAGTIKLEGATINAAVDNSTTGTIEVVGFTSTNTIGGTLTNPADPVKGTTGLVQVDDGATLKMTGSTIQNDGTIALDSAGSGASLIIGAPNVALKGGGSLIMSNSAGNVIAGSAPANILTNNETIQGSGNIGNGSLGFVNNGTIHANRSTPLIINPSSAGFKNNGTLIVDSGDTLQITGPPGSFLNFSGTTLTGGTYWVLGTLQFDGANIVTNATDLKLLTSSSKIIDQNGVNALANFNTNAAGASFELSGPNFTTAGNFTNNGILKVGNAISTFKVNGNLTNFSGGALAGGTYDLTGKLQFDGANIVTNAANIALNGSSSGITDQFGLDGLANFSTNAATGSFTVAGGRTFVASGFFKNNAGATLTIDGTGSNFSARGTFTNNGTLDVINGASDIGTDPATFTNNGVLTVGSASSFSTGGSLTNFSGTTLKGGTYNVTGTLQFPGANIVTNAANIALIGSGSKIVDQIGTTDGLRNFATNSATGNFSISSGRNFTTAANFTNLGTLSVGAGSTFTLAALANFTQTGGKTTDDGTLATSGTVNLSGGSLFGKGTIAGALNSSGTIAPGDSSTSTGALAVSKTYTQNSSGVLDISIGGTTAGTKFDQLKVSGAASVNGTLNLTLINGFVPAVGTTFDILTGGSVSGMFSTVNGKSINGSEHFVVTCDSTDCDATVMSGASSPLQASSFARRSYTAVFGRNFEQNIWSSSQPSGVRVSDRATFKTADLPIHNFARIQADSASTPTFRVGAPVRFTPNLVNRNAVRLAAGAAFKSVPKSSPTTRQNFFRSQLNGMARGGVNTPAMTPLRSTRVLGRNKIEYGFDLLSILKIGARHNLRTRTEPSGGTRFGYLVLTNSY